MPATCKICRSPEGVCDEEIHQAAGWLAHVRTRLLALRPRLFHEPLFERPYMTARRIDVMIPIRQPLAEDLRRLVVEGRNRRPKP